jgi:type IV secretion system protein VirB4
MFSLKEYREPSHKLSDVLPWAALIAPGVVLQKERLVQKTIAFRGPDLSSSSEPELLSATARLNNALKRLGEGWALFIEAQRFECTDYPASSWSHPAAWLVDLERKCRFEEEGAHFESHYFLTFVWQLPARATKRLQGIFFSDPQKADEASELERDIAHFQAHCQELIDIMQSVFIEVHPLDDDETLTYLHSTISTQRHPVKAPEVPMYLDALLPDESFCPGDIPLLGSSFLPTLSFTGFPSTSLPGMLDALNHLRLSYRWVTRFIALDRTSAQSELETLRKRWWQKRKSLWMLIKEEAAQQPSALLDSAAAQKSTDADAALQELGEDLVAFGYLTSTVTVWHPDLEEARRRIAHVKKVIQSRGFVVREESFGAMQAWLGSLPGHVFANVRRPLLHTLNLAHIMPLSAIWSGTENEHLKERFGCSAPHVLTSTTGSTPFRLNLNVGDVGHTLILGPTGSGKSTLLNLLALGWLKYPGAQVFIFDKDRSARAATLAVNGHYYEPGGEGPSLAFQPLMAIDQAHERLWASEFIQNLLLAQSMPLSASAKKEIDQALESLASDAPAHRTLSVFCDLVQSRDIREALRPYSLSGHYGRLFDADGDDFRSGRWIMVEMGHLMQMGEAVIVPALDVLFHRIEAQFTGRPTLLILDEAWLFLSHSVFMRRLQSWLKTLRKKNVYVVFATQEVADAMDSPILPTMISACHVKIFLPDEEATSPAMMRAYQELGLSETEIGILATAQKKRDYYYRSSKGRRLFTLDLGPIALTFTGLSSPAEHLFLDDMIKSTAPEAYPQAMLRYRGLGWAADLLERASQEGRYDI